MQRISTSKQFLGRTVIHRHCVVELTHQAILTNFTAMSLAASIKNIHLIRLIHSIIEISYYFRIKSNQIQ